MFRVLTGLNNDELLKLIVFFFVISGRDGRDGYPGQPGRPGFRDGFPGKNNFAGLRLILVIQMHTILH